MITAQDIREKSFEKLKLGGYDAASVDDFLELLADELTAVQKDNAAMRSKMKILVDKVEEYRANEDALNMAVLSAQKLAIQIEAEAKERAAAILGDAEKQAKARLGGLDAEVEAEQKRLVVAQAATDKFFSAIKALCAAQLQNLEKIDAGLFDKASVPATAPAAAPTVDEAVRSIEKSVSRIQPEPDVRIDIGPAKKAPSAPVNEQDPTRLFDF